MCTTQFAEYHYEGVHGLYGRAGGIFPAGLWSDVWHGCAGIVWFVWFFDGGRSFTFGIEDPVEAFWLFQAAFAIAMATIVSGAVAERMKFAPYLVFPCWRRSLSTRWPVIGSGIRPAG